MKKVIMTKPQAIKEHKELVKVLKNPNKTKLKKEAKKQTKELKKYSRL